MRQFNVYSEELVLAPNETFEWMVNASEISSGTTVTISSTDWPLPDPSYTVTAGTPLTVTASNTPNATGTFECSPDDSNVSTHNMIIASQGFIPVCSSVTVNPGEYFIWQNLGANAVSIVSDPLDKRFWPLSGQGHQVGPESTTAVQVPEDAEEYTTGYLLKVTSGGQAICDDATQPRLIVGSGK